MIRNYTVVTSNSSRIRPGSIGRAWNTMDNRLAFETQLPDGKVKIYFSAFIKAVKTMGLLKKEIEYQMENGTHIRLRKI